MKKIKTEKLVIAGRNQKKNKLASGFFRNETKIQKRYIKSGQTTNGKQTKRRKRIANIKVIRDCVEEKKSEMLNDAPSTLRMCIRRKEIKYDKHSIQTTTTTSKSNWTKEREREDGVETCHEIFSLFFST